MSAPTRSRRLMRLGIGMLAVLGIAVVSVQSAPAQTRMLAALGDVPAYVPAPYHPHAITATYGYARYDGYPYYGGGHLGGGVHYWH